MLDDYNGILDRIRAWWHHENDAVLLAFSQPKSNAAKIDANKLWISADDEPDYDRLIDAFISSTVMEGNASNILSKELPSSI